MARLSKEVKQAQEDLKKLKKQLSGFDDIDIKVFNDASKNIKSLNTDIKAAQALLADLKPDL